MTVYGCLSHPLPLPQANGGYPGEHYTWISMQIRKKFLAIAIYFGIGGIFFPGTN
jgi:hypothetical protein